MTETADAKTPTESFFPSSKKDFKGKLFEAFLAADIPQICQPFTDLGQSVPSDNVCSVHMDMLAADKEHLYSKKVFLVIDESEVSGSEDVNILIGNITVPEKTYFLDCNVVETVNQQVVITKIDDALKKHDIERNNFVVLLSNAVNYMAVFTATIRILYPQICHIICMANLLHNCAERMARGHFKEIDSLIATVKAAATMMNKNQRYKFNAIGSPPQPVLTRWGTWLNAAQHHVKNFVEVRDIINSFEGNGVQVKRARAVLKSFGIFGEDSPRLPSASAAHKKKWTASNTYLQKRTWISLVCGPDARLCISISTSRNAW